MCVRARGEANPLLARPRNVYFEDAIRLVLWHPQVALPVDCDHRRGGLALKEDSTASADGIGWIILLGVDCPHRKGLLEKLTCAHPTTTEHGGARHRERATLNTGSDAGGESEVIGPCAKGVC